MSDLIKIAEVHELSAGQCKVVSVNNQEIALFNVGGKFFATDNVCPHRGGPLGEGTLDGNIVTCPWHGWRFDVCTGVSPIIPTAKVPSFPCTVEGNDVKVKLD